MGEIESAENRPDSYPQIISLSLWRLFYRRIGWPILFFVFRVLSQTSQKIKTGLQMRKRNISGESPWATGIKNLKPIWIHCASGEFEYAKPVICAIKKSRPQAKILVTYFSPSYSRQVTEFSGVDIASPSPWDTPDAIDELLSHHQPQCLLLARTDTWPEMLRQAKSHSLPVLLFSATLAEGAGRLKGISRFITRLVFRDIDAIFCVSQADLIAFRSVGAGSRAMVCGDTRFDQVLARLSEDSRLSRLPWFSQLTLWTKDKNVLVAGSTWPEDETVLLKVIEHFKSQITSQMKFIIVPHEPTAEHIATLKEQLSKQSEKTQLKFACLSELSHNQLNVVDLDVLIVDATGFLADLYRLGYFAFVGGSFRKTVHSVMEPLAAGALTFVGPKIRNNREAVEFSHIACSAEDALHCVEVVASDIAFCKRLQTALETFGQVNSRAIRTEVEKRAGTSRLVADWALSRAQFPTGQE